MDVCVRARARVCVGERDRDRETERQTEREKDRERRGIERETERRSERDRQRERERPHQQKTLRNRRVVGVENSCMQLFIPVCSCVRERH